MYKIKKESTENNVTYHLAKGHQIHFRPYGEAPLRDALEELWQRQQQEPATGETPRTNADRLRAMDDRALAQFLLSVQDRGSGPWEFDFERKFCDSCPTRRVEDLTSVPLEIHECDFSDGVCPHGDSCTWWLMQEQG